MKKQTNCYLEIEPWAIIEKGFHKERSRVSESIFSLANEFMGIRGHFDEGYGGDSLVGAYFNGVFVEQPHVYPVLHKGLPVRNHFMVNAVNWLHTRIIADGEKLDLAVSKITGFVRTLDLRAGTMTRSFTWTTAKGRKLNLKFTRFLSMTRPHLGCQRIEVEPVDFTGRISILLGLDLSPIHENAGRNFWTCVKKGKEGAASRAVLGEAFGSGQKVFSMLRYHVNLAPATVADVDADGENEKLAGVRLEFQLSKGTPLTLDRMVAHHVEKEKSVPAREVWKAGVKQAKTLLHGGFDAVLAEQRDYWGKIWERFDISIEGDPANEQGTRYCIFQMVSTYHGLDPRLNIGAKGLTGEAYGGLAFWDTETYCLP